MTCDGLAEYKGRAGAVDGYAFIRRRGGMGSGIEP